MPKPFRIEVLRADHDVSEFASGEEALNLYLQRIARQDSKRYVANVYILVDATTSRIAGFYTLSALSVQLTNLPEDLRKRMPRYPDIPAILIGRLARALPYRGYGCGELLLVDALRRAGRASSEVAAFAVVVDAKTAEAAAFYR